MESEQTLTEEQQFIVDADNLNSQSFVFKTPNGAINYNFRGFPGLCGMLIIYDVYFGRIKEGMVNEFYKEVQEHLRNKKYVDHLNRGNLMMSDAVGGEKMEGISKEELGLPCIYSMCKYLGWDESKHRYNPRTGNKIVIFTTSREVTNRYGRYPKELDYTTGDFIV